MNILVYDINCKSSGVEYPIKDALESMGHDVIMFDWTLHFNSIVKESLFNKIKDKLFLKVIEIKINKEINKVINNNHFDLFLVMRGDHLFPETLSLCRNRIKMIVNWNTDDLFNRLNSSELIIDSLSFYDIHFSPRYSLKSEYLSSGAKSFELLNWYYRYGIDYSKYSRKCYGYLHDSTFIGSWSERREEFLSDLYDCKIDIYGWGWNKKIKKDKYKNWVLSPSISIVKMHDEFYKSKININILTLENRDTTNLRNFEIPASGAFQLSERSDEILNLFEEDKEIVCFSSKEELFDKYKFYLKNDNLREKIAIAGQNKIFTTKNSLTDRLTQIIDKLY
jgi:spore maturation protein CgeB